MPRALRRANATQRRGGAARCWNISPKEWPRKVGGTDICRRQHSLSAGATEDSSPPGPIEVTVEAATKPWNQWGSETREGGRGGKGGKGHRVLHHYDYNVNIRAVRVFEGVEGGEITTVPPEDRIQ